MINLETKTINYDGKRKLDGHWTVEAVSELENVIDPCIFNHIRQKINNMS